MGPCLCGDPYCSSCGDPGLADLEAAEEDLMEAFKDFSPDEYAIAKSVAIAAVEAHRKAAKEISDKVRADYGAHIDYLECEIAVLRGNRGAL